MNIYKVSRKDDWDYDEYDSAIVAAEYEEQAMSIPPGYNLDTAELVVSLDEYMEMYGIPNYWNPNNLNIELVGTTDKYNEPITLLASFNMG